MMNNRITIIGGMGPQASLELHRRILARAADLGATNGGDFPEITHISLPIDDFISDSSKTVQAIDTIEAAMRRLYLWRQQFSTSMQYGSFTCARARA